MVRVLFKCNEENRTMFRLYSFKDMDYVPMKGDIIKTDIEDFFKATFRVKPFKGIDDVCLDFEVVIRQYCLTTNRWELTCKPTSESLAFLLKNINAH